MIEQFHANIDSMSHAIPMLRTLVCPLSDAQIRRKPAPTEWSIVEIVGHLIDTEQLLRYRIIRMTTLDHPAIIPYDQDAAVVRHGYQHADLNVLLRTLATERETTLQTFKGFTPTQLARTGWHLEYGLWVVANVVTYLAKHDSMHDQQIRNAIRHP
jgi:hypothetical protein